MTPGQAKIMRLLKDAGKPLNCREIASAVGITVSAAKWQLNRLAREGLAGNTHTGRYAKWTTKEEAERWEREKPAEEKRAMLDENETDPIVRRWLAQHEWAWGRPHP